MLVTIKPELKTLTEYQRFVQFTPRSHAYTSWIKSLFANFRIPVEDVRVEFIPMDIEEGRAAAHLLLAKATNIVAGVPELQDEFNKLADAVAAADTVDDLLLQLTPISELYQRALARPYNMATAS